MTFLRQRETSRISSRGKGPVYNTGGGGGSSSAIRLNHHAVARSQGWFALATDLSSSSSSCSLCGELHDRPKIADEVALQRHWSARTLAPCRFKLYARKSTAPAACMIIEDPAPLSGRPRYSCGNTHQPKQQHDIAQNQLILLKHRTAKFSSNRHRKLQPFRET